MFVFRVGPDIRWSDIIRPDIDFCRISRYPISGFLRTGYPVSGQIFDYFEQKFKIYPFIFYSAKKALE